MGQRAYIERAPRRGMELNPGVGRIRSMGNRARRLRLAACWLGECFREVAVLLAVFLPLDAHLERSSYTMVNIIAFLLFVLLIFMFGVTIGLIGELEPNE